MKPFPYFVLFVLFVLFCLRATADTYTTATIAITNSANATNGARLVLQGQTITWTNTSIAALLLKPRLVAYTNTPAAAATNLYTKLTSAFGNALFFNYGSSTSVLVRAASGTTLSASVFSNWATLSFTTNQIATTNMIGSLAASNLISKALTLLDSADPKTITNWNQITGGGGAATNAIANLNGLGTNTTLLGSNYFTLFTFATNLPRNELTLESFGAVGDGRVLNRGRIAAGTNLYVCTNAAFVAGDVGKAISIFQAGQDSAVHVGATPTASTTNGLNLSATISTIVNSTHVLISSNAVLGMTNYAAVYGTDDTVPIQRALDFFTNGPLTLIVPNRIYLIAGPLRDTGTNISFHNAQLYLPNGKVRGKNCDTLRIVGVGSAYSRGDNSLYPNDLAFSGSTFFSTLARGPGGNGGGRVLDCQNFNGDQNTDDFSPVTGGCNGQDIVHLNNVTMEVRGMNWYCARDSDLRVLDLSGADNCIVEDVCIGPANTTTWTQGSKSYTGTNGIGLLMTGSFNENISTADRVMVRGMFTGMQKQENFLGGQIFIADCQLAVDNGVASTKAIFNYLNVQECSNVFNAKICEVTLDANLQTYNYTTYPVNYIFTGLYDNLYGQVVVQSFGSTSTRLNVAGVVPANLRVLDRRVAQPQQTLSPTVLSNTFYGHKVIGVYGWPNPALHFSTNIQPFHTSPQWTLYQSGGSGSLTLEHSQRGRNAMVINWDTDVTFFDQVTAGASGFSGAGSLLTALNADNISSGTLNNARLDAELQALAGLTSAADKIPYFTGSGSAGLLTIGSGVTFSGGTLSASGDASLLTSGTMPDARLSTNVKINSLGITIDGGGSAITTGVKGYIEVPYACTIQRVTMLADQSGSAVVDVWKDTYANYPPTVADTITASAKPTITSATKSQDATLTGWTTTVNAGDIIAFNVDSASTITRLHIILKVTR